MRHNLKLAQDADGLWRVYGAVVLRGVRFPVVAAVAKMLETGVATLADSICATWDGSPIIASIGRMVRYRPSVERIAIQDHLNTMARPAWHS
jgi:hypothetical protein